MPILHGRFPDRYGRAPMAGVVMASVDRYRWISNGRIGRIARKFAAMRVPDRLTLKMTVKICGSAASALGAAPHGACLRLVRPFLVAGVLVQRRSAHGTPALAHRHLCAAWHGAL